MPEIKGKFTPDVSKLQEGITPAEQERNKKLSLYNVLYKVYT